MRAAVVLICFAPPTRRRRPLYIILLCIVSREHYTIGGGGRWVVGRRSSSGIRAEIHQWYSVSVADYDVFVPLEEENGPAVHHHLPSCPGVVSCHTTFSRSFISRPAAAPNAICATITPSHRHCTVTDDHHHRHRLRLCH